MPTLTARLRRTVLGAPKDVKDPHAFHKLSLVALLAWVGLGADGLSSSSYGPDEAFRALVDDQGQFHTGLAVGLAAATALTVFIISYGYSRIIEQFPAGGGYVVASKILGPRVGVVSGAALLVDYVLTITISISSARTPSSAFSPAAPVQAPLRLRGPRRAHGPEPPRREGERDGDSADLRPLPPDSRHHPRRRDRRSRHRDRRGLARGAHQRQRDLDDPRDDGDAPDLPPRLLPRRRHVHRYRGRLQRPPDDA